MVYFFIYNDLFKSFIFKFIFLINSFIIVKLERGNIIYRVDLGFFFWIGVYFLILYFFYEVLIFCKRYI